MNKTMQDGNEMQDEELYALLDKALCTERLTVSEELIQKTLQRVAVEEDSKVISFEKAKKKIPYVRYAGVAAAAVLVLFVGVRTLGGGAFSAKDNTAPMEASWEDRADRAEAVGRKSDADAMNETYVADGVQYSYSSQSNSGGGKFEAEDNDYSLIADSAADEEVEWSAEMPTAGSRGGEVSMDGVTVTVSENLAEILADARMAVKTGEAEYWEFAATGTNWETELVYALRAGVVEKSGLPEDGSYSYTLKCKDGSRWNIQYNRPLDAVIRLKTEQGVIWGLLGEGVSFYME